MGSSEKEFVMDNIKPENQKGEIEISETILYLNMDRSLVKKGKRRGVKITEKELFQKIYTRQTENNPDWMDKVSFADFTLNKINQLFYCNFQIAKDLSKITFAKFKTIANPAKLKEESLIGIHTLSNGLTFMGATASGGDECPVFFIIYWDGSALRGYVPKYGNLFNPDFKSAIGLEGSNKAVNNKKILKKAPYNGCASWEAGRIYLKSLFPNEVDANTRVAINWKAIEEDITYRIEITSGESDVSDKF